MNSAQAGLALASIITLAGCHRRARRDGAEGAQPTAAIVTDGDASTAPIPTASVDVATDASSARHPLPPMPLVSLGVPAYASDEFPGSKASMANDADYEAGWRSSTIPWPATPAWLAYDLSKIPEMQRKRVMVEWFHDHGYAHYETGGVMEVAFDLPRDYQLQIHAAPGGGAPPAPNDPGWTTVATVTYNTLISGQHLVQVDPGGVLHPWLRLRCTAPYGNALHQHLAIGMDVFDASAGTDDDWIFFGDSITAMTINVFSDVGCSAPCPYGRGTIAQRIHAAKPSYYPLVEGAGIGGYNSTQGVATVRKFLPRFPGRFVALNFGTNDAFRCTEDRVRAFRANMESMVTMVLAAGKIPVIPKIPWAPSAEHRAGIPLLNAQIDALYAAHPEIMRGPDLYALFEKTPSLIAADALHPSDMGVVAYRDAWAKAILAAGIYP